MIRRAEPHDLPAVLALLTEAKLPTDGVAEDFAREPTSATALKWSRQPH
jgi:hypothetical protein